MQLVAPRGRGVDPKIPLAAGSLVSGAPVGLLARPVPHPPPREGPPSIAALRPAQPELLRLLRVSRQLEVGARWTPALPAPARSG